MTEPHAHPLVVTSSQLILAGDIEGAEQALVALADEEGDHALVRVLDELAPKDLLAIMREYDSSKETIVNMLVTPEQFARAIVLERLYGERTSERLRAMVNTVIHQDETRVTDYLEAIAETDGGLVMLADYFEDRYDEILSFATRGRFAPEIEFDGSPQLHITWLAEKLDELDESLGFGNFIENSKPQLERDEVADGDWMETAWLLRQTLPDVFEELIILLRERMQKHLDAQNALLAAVLASPDEDDDATPGAAAEESAI